MSENNQCPKCGEECQRDEVDVGVGVITGPWGCYSCGWSDDPRYDSSNGASVAQAEYPDHYLDPCGGATPLKTIERKLDRLGLVGKAIVDEVFRTPVQEANDA